MKKITFSHTAKRIAMFAGLAVVCVAALSLVYSRVNAAQPTEASSSTSSDEIVMASPNSITVPPISSEGDESGTGSAFVPSSGATASKPLTVVSKPSSQPPKPTPPASSALTNKAKKPSYSVTPKAPASSTSPTKPTYTGNNDPIFGNTHGTGGKAINSPDAGGDINKQIGTMG